MRYEQTIKILRVKWLLQSNKKSLLPKLPLKPEFESLLTDFHQAEQIPGSVGVDGELLIKDEINKQPSICTVDDKTIAKGAFAQLTKQTRDLRYTIFGNEGLVFRRTLELLEGKYNIFSFHACAMYQPAGKRLFLIVGSAGSGKTCFMLTGIQRGLQLFSAEMGHFRLHKGGLEFYKGALIDNIRIGNLKYNYPFILKKLNLKLGRTRNEWGKKIPLELHRFQTKANKIVNPEVVILLPRVEEGRKSHFSQEVQDHRMISRVLFENASEKIGQSVLLYESIPFVCLDTPRAANRRIEAIKTLLAHKSLKKVVTILSGPDDCWKGILD